MTTKIEKSGYYCRNGHTTDLVTTEEGTIHVCSVCGDPGPYRVIPPPPVIPFGEEALRQEIAMRVLIAFIESGSSGPREHKVAAAVTYADLLLERLRQVPQGYVDIDESTEP